MLVPDQVSQFFWRSVDAGAKDKGLRSSGCGAGGGGSVTHFYEHPDGRRVGITLSADDYLDAIRNLVSIKLAAVE